VVLLKKGCRDTQQFILPEKGWKRDTFSLFLLVSAGICGFSGFFAQITPGLILDFLQKALDCSSDKHYYHISRKKANIQLIFCREAKYKAGRNLFRFTKAIVSCSPNCEAKISVFEKE